MRFTRLLMMAACGTLCLACDSDPKATQTVDSTDSVPASDTTTPVPEAPEAVGHCVYTNTFSQAAECKEYLGSGWTLELAQADCDAPIVGAPSGAFVSDVACSREQVLGECQIDAGTPEHQALVFPGGPDDSCDGLEFGCSLAGGEFIPSETCAGGEGPVGSAQVFQPFEHICVPPLAGEPEGQSAGGEVCTWEAISGATEEGRYFPDYASCDVVRTQRPYWSGPATNDSTEDDPRLQDPAWMTEYEWVTSQLNATACTCCHTAAESPGGFPSGWYLESGPVWTDSFEDDGMAMMAGWVDSTVFGAFHAEDNNGFSRDRTGMPTTNPDRMVDYFEGELARRGLTQADFSDTPPFGGPLYDQLVYEPQACAAGDGIDAAGTITWTGGPARYVYVLEEDSLAPGVPPNLDLPSGTIWRLDADYEADAFSSGIRYGEAPLGTSVNWPATGTAPELVTGQTYYLYALADVYVPITRCLFVAP